MQAHNLQSYLAKHPEMELYGDQDQDAVAAAGWTALPHPGVHPGRKPRDNRVHVQV